MFWEYVKGVVRDIFWVWFIIRSNLENFGKMIRKLKERKFFFNDEDEDILEDILWKFSKEIVIWEWIFKKEVIFDVKWKEK